MQNQRFHPHKLAVCQQTGSLICAIDRFIKFFRLVECINENTHFKYIDFIELPFEVELEFVAIYLEINEHIIGCGNREFMCVFKLLERNYYNTADSDVLSANSLTTSSELSGIGALNCSSQHPTMDLKKLPNEFTFDGNGCNTFDYKNITEKWLTSIKSNISSTFDFQAKETNSNEKGRLERNRRSIELKPIFIDSGALSLCNLRHSSISHEEVIIFESFFL